MRTLPCAPIKRPKQNINNADRNGKNTTAKYIKQF